MTGGSDAQDRNGGRGVLQRSMPRARRRSSPKAEASPSAKADAPERDVVLVHGVTEDGQGLQVLRCRGDRLEAGAVRPLREGRPIHGEVVKLSPRRELPLVCDVEVAVPAPASAVKDRPATRTGPAQVVTDQYRRNWDTIWRRPKSARPN